MHHLPHAMSPAGVVACVALGDVPMFCQRPFDVVLVVCVPQPSSINHPAGKVRDLLDSIASLTVIDKSSTYLTDLAVIKPRGIKVPTAWAVIAFSTFGPAH